MNKTPPSLLLLFLLFQYSCEFIGPGWTGLQARLALGFSLGTKTAGEGPAT